MPQVDVVIPNYNYGRYLQQCVESVTRQGVADIRVLIIDNASHDNSVEVALKLARSDPRITVIAREHNLGHHASYNEGIDWAAAKYFVLLCADDLLVEGCFSRSLDVLERNADVSFASGSELVWRVTDPVPSPANEQLSWRFLGADQFALERSLPSQTLFGGGAALVRTSDLKRVGYFRSEVSFNEDLEMFLRLSLNRRVAITNAVHGIRRVHGENMSAILWNDFKREMVETKCAFDSFFLREGAQMHDGPRLHRQICHNLGKRAYRSALSHTVRGQPRAGFELFKLALHFSPRLAFLPPLYYLVQLGDPVAHIRARLSGLSSKTSS